MRCASSSPSRASVSSASAQRADERVAVVLGRERRQDVVGHRPAVATAGPADPDTHAEEVGGAERLLDRAQAVVAGKPAAEAHLQPAKLEIDLVVDDRDRTPA